MVPKQHHPLHVHFYSQHQLQLLLSRRLRLQGHSTDRSPPGIWFNPDQMLIGAVCLLAICLGFRSTVASCAEPCGAELPCQRLGCPETTSQPEDTSWPIVANQHSLWTDSAVGNAIKLIFLWIIGQLVHTLPLTPLKSISEGLENWAIGCFSLNISLKAENSVALHAAGDHHRQYHDFLLQPLFKTIMFQQLLMLVCIEQHWLACSGGCSDSSESGWTK